MILRCQNLRKLRSEWAEYLGPDFGRRRHRCRQQSASHVMSDPPNKNQLELSGSYSGVVFGYTYNKREMDFEQPVRWSEITNDPFILIKT